MRQGERGPQVTTELAAFGPEITTPALCGSGTSLKDMNAFLVCYHSYHTARASGSSRACGSAPTVIGERYLQGNHGTSCERSVNAIQHSPRNTESPGDTSYAIAVGAKIKGGDKQNSLSKSSKWFRLLSCK